MACSHQEYSAFTLQTRHKMANENPEEDDRIISEKLELPCERKSVFIKPEG